MSRYRGPITKISRRLGVVLFANGESKLKAFNKKRYKPGMHGQKMTGKLSEFGKQLQEKQKARFMYGITEKQSQRYFDTARKSQGTTGEKYFQLLEQRLDNVIFRAGFANSRNQSRQIVNHGLVTLNGKRADIASIQVKPGDKFEIRKNRKDSKLFEDAKKAKHNPPKWLKVDIKNLSGEILMAPDKDDRESIIDSQMIVEFYSK